MGGEVKKRGVWGLGGWVEKDMEVGGEWVKVGEGLGIDRFIGRWGV